ncbi:MAG: AIR synthase-related protein, partial [Clostridia bacterium]
PRYISAGFIIETGMPICELQAIARSMGETARAAGVTIAAADTKVIEGTGGIYINTSGIGIIPEGRAPHANKCRAGDVLIVSGNLGDHHACIMSARMGIENDIKSDAAPLTKQVEALYSAGVSPRAMRDVTRGGLGTVLNELANASHCACTLFESAIPIASSTRALCDILGLDPLYMGNEGTFITAVAPDESEKALEVLKKFGNAAIIGEFCTGEHVRIHTEFGGVRVVPPLYGEGLPRIC